MVSWSFGDKPGSGGDSEVDECKPLPIPSYLPRAPECYAVEQRAIIFHHRSVAAQVEFESKIVGNLKQLIIFEFHADSSDAFNFQRGFDRVNMHRPTAVSPTTMPVAWSNMIPLPKFAAGCKSIPKTCDYGPADDACHVIGWQITQDTRVEIVMYEYDVAGGSCLPPHRSADNSRHENSN